MAMFRKVMPVQSAQIAENRTRVIAATNQLARDGHILEPAGIETANFLRVGTILFNHDADVAVGTPVAAGLDTEGNLWWKSNGRHRESARRPMRCAVL
jgi:hypothetical protein